MGWWSNPIRRRDTSTTVTDIKKPLIDLEMPLTAPKATNPTSNTINAKSAYHVVAESVVVNIITAHFLFLLRYIIHTRAGYCKKKLQKI